MAPGGATPMRQRRAGPVWGCERPELLITETLAWHDRRTEDLTDGGGTGGGLELRRAQRFRPATAADASLFH